ncbi:MAG: hypothetical protein HFJ46_07820 [Clostridia bacterium]|nr:hypothetical protein [Clostridia bacterium]
MGVINWVALGGILVDLVVISILISNAFWGYRKGLVAVVFKILTFLISLIIVFMLYRPVANSIMKNTQLDEKLAIAIEKNLTGTTLENGELLKPQNSSVSEGVINVINSFVVDALNETSVNAVEYVSENLAVMMIRTGTFLGLFIIARFLLLFVRFVAELIANLPIIKMFNKSGGLIYGIVKGFLVAYLIFAIFSLISPVISNLGIIKAIDDSIIGSKMYNNNIILNIIFK